MANKYNHEGYYDPTAYFALKRIETEEKKSRYRPMVYICSPYSGDIYDNVLKARKYSRFAVESHCIPVTPHLFFPQFMNDDIPEERDAAFKMNNIMLSKCDELWVFGSRYTEGMQREMKWAKRKKIHIRFFDENGKEL